MVGIFRKHLLCLREEGKSRGGAVEVRRTIVLANGATITMHHAVQLDILSLGLITVVELLTRCGILVERPEQQIEVNA